MGVSEFYVAVFCNVLGSVNISIQSLILCFESQLRVLNRGKLFNERPVLPATEIVIALQLFLRNFNSQNGALIDEQFLQSRVTFDFGRVRGRFSARRGRGRHAMARF